jgi:hypothetical protein
MINRSTIISFNVMGKINIQPGPRGKINKGRGKNKCARKSTECQWVWSSVGTDILKIFETGRGDKKNERSPFRAARRRGGESSEPAEGRGWCDARDA